MIVAASVTLWAAAAVAEGNSPADASSGEPPPASTATTPAPAQPPAPPAPPAPVPTPSVTPAQPAPSASAPVLPTGTPATVLDTQDYEGVLGKGVRSSTGEDMGRIIDIILDKDGRPRAAIIDFGGFLGVGSRKIAVDWRSMRFTPDGKPSRLILQLSRNQVRVSPEYKPGEPIVVLGPASPSVTPEGEQVAAPAQPAAAAPPAPAQPAATPSPAPDKPAEKTPDK